MAAELGAESAKNYVTFLHIYSRECALHSETREQASSELGFLTLEIFFLLQGTLFSCSITQLMHLYLCLECKQLQFLLKVTSFISDSFLSIPCKVAIVACSEFMQGLP